MSNAAIPYGAWPSPITAADVASERLRLSDLQLDGAGVYWVEGRPGEGGRCVIVRHAGGTTHDLIEAPFSARTFVHEYGGGALRVARGRVYFSNAADGVLYVLEPGGRPDSLTPSGEGLRFADMEDDPARDRIVAVAEHHAGERVLNQIVAVPCAGGSVRTLVSGNDFYSNPRVSPDGSKLCWLTWNQPNMPWDGTELWAAELDAEGTPRAPRLVCGGARESIFQPSWSPAGVLHCVSDRTGWWNLYRVEDGELQPLLSLEAECGVPAWVFQLSTYAFLDAERLALGVCRQGLWSLGVLDSVSSVWTPFALPYNDLDGYVDASSAGIVVMAGGPREPASIVHVDPETGAHRVLRRSSSVRIDDALVSEAQPITFPGWQGATAHAFFYPPRNPSVQPDPASLPPLYVHAHGGPTSACSAVLDPVVQYWTSRGFAFVDVNYGGSVGYGRPYRERLREQQGVVDVGDCVMVARHLAEAGTVEPERMVIEGGSAGGYIVLCAMTYHDVFAAGVSLFGISDMELLAQETHKFEARYLDSLLGPYPEALEVYRARSPIHHIGRVRRAVLLLQGLDDPIVPANQAQLMYDALRERGIPCAYIAFAGEQHGFRRAESIRRTLEAELYFLSRVLGFDTPDAVEPVEVANLEPMRTA